jgi:hypothetical protein
MLKKNCDPIPTFAVQPQKVYKTLCKKNTNWGGEKGEVGKEDYGLFKIAECRLKILA